LLNAEPNLADNGGSFADMIAVIHAAIHDDPRLPVPLMRLSRSRITPGLGCYCNSPHNQDRNIDNEKIFILQNGDHRNYAMLY
jgi:hypothetical protein